MTLVLHIRGYHPLWPAFPCRSASTKATTGLIHFRSPLLAESPLMSFPPGTEMFQFPGFASCTYVFSARYPKGVGCPIRTPRDQSLLAAPPGFSQRATSFIASWRQGIHQMPFSYSNLNPPCTGTIHAPNPCLSAQENASKPPIPRQAISITQHTYTNAPEHCSPASNRHHTPSSQRACSTPGQTPMPAQPRTPTNRTPNQPAP